MQKHETKQLLVFLFFLFQVLKQNEYHNIPSLRSVETQDANDGLMLNTY
jgi:hypothetical protein